MRITCVWCVCMREQRRQIKKVRAHRLPRVRCTDPMGLVEVRKLARTPKDYQKKKKKKLEHTDILDAELDKFIPAKSHISQKQIDEAFA
jgi:hypothetical protein